MLRFSAPSEIEVQQFLSRQTSAAYSYPEVGASAISPHSGYNIDRNRILLGSGEDTWHRAVQAVHQWKMFEMPWTRLFWPTTSIEVGADVAILVRALGLYWLNACRVIYVIHDDRPICRFGFAYGTLAEHAETGEERFSVEWNRSNDQVSYDILAFSRPHQLLAKLGYPISRILQRRFAADSLRAMQKAVGCV
jgi:uncharacterized protein (UPF0548 family)